MGHGPNNLELILNPMGLLIERSPQRITLVIFLVCSSIYINFLLGRLHNKSSLMVTLWCLLTFSIKKYVSNYYLKMIYESNGN